MYGYIYLTTNLVNGKKYIGQHKSSEFDKNYKGSGKTLKQAFEKYGWDNFKTELLVECNSRDELNNLEIEEISKRDAINSKEYYNLSGGGEGWSSQWCRKEFVEMQKEKGPVQARTYTSERRELLRQAMLKRYEDPLERMKVSQQMKELQKDGGFMKGKHHSEETKLKMSESHKGISPNYRDKDAWRASVGRDMQGELNPMYGKIHSSTSKILMSEKRTLHNIGCCWINNGEVEKFVKSSEEVNKLLEQGFVLGRLYHPRKKKSSTTIESVDSEKNTIE